MACSWSWAVDLALYRYLLHLVDCGVDSLLWLEAGPGL